MKLGHSVGSPDKTGKYPLKLCRAKKICTNCEMKLGHSVESPNKTGKYPLKLCRAKNLLDLEYSFEFQDFFFRYKPTEELYPGTQFCFVEHQFAIGMDWCFVLVDVHFEHQFAIEMHSDSLFSWRAFKFSSVTLSYTSISPLVFQL